jgi:hypothetical protein
MECKVTHEFRLLMSFYDRVAFGFRLAGAAFDVTILLTVPLVDPPGA